MGMMQEVNVAVLQLIRAQMLKNLVERFLTCFPKVHRDLKQEEEKKSIIHLENVTSLG